MHSTSPLLEVNNLRVYFPYHGKKSAGSQREVRAVDNLSFSLQQGETLGLVGESGCGKSTLARAIVRLFRPHSGEILFRGRDLAVMEGEPLRQVRSELQMVFQDPYSSLNPRMTVRDIVAEPLRNFGRTEGLVVRVRELLGTVGLDASAMNRYPHEFSGGQRQRIGIARALALNPAVVVADEPASALDVSVQAQIVTLLKELQATLRLSFLFISHDLSLVSLLSHRVAVMYLGEIVETGPATAIFSNPWHPYSEALISAIPIPDPEKERLKTRIVLRGDVPSPLSKPPGCPFHPRCPYVFDRCRIEHPALKAYGSERWVSCHLLDEPNRSPRPASAHLPTASL
ncbi:MAG: peptide ABC transporter substrate-binding protein [Acidobacteria bacterium RIFCSPLOWO2_12_FULL_54_10]|nr:MAG: peptide ABC transporter substrate-binding protein [Acidobacteria bacterium RIFCSPLOWO2_12_FULL_54_10]